MPYIKSICKAGKTIEVAAYYTRRYKPKDGRRGKKERETTEKQQQINDRQLEKKLTRIINASFDGDSWYITLTYKTENRPKDAEELKRHIREFLKRLRKVYKQEGRELKYIETAEVGERGAMHIHILVNDIDTRKIARLWDKGFINAKPLDSSGQYRKLAAYFIKYAQKTRKTCEAIQKKAYNCSRNLIRPEPKKIVMYGNRYRKKIRIKDGYYLDKESVYMGTDAEGYERLEYTLIKKDRSYKRVHDRHRDIIKTTDSV